MNKESLIVLRNDEVKLSIPRDMVVKVEGRFPFCKTSAGVHPFISRGACEKEGLDSKKVQSEFISGKRSVADSSHLILGMGMNPDGHEIVTDSERNNRADARYLDQKRLKFASQIAEAKESGKLVKISSEKWVETRKVREGGELGEYQFMCSRTEFVDGSGNFTAQSSAVNSY